MGKRTIKNKAIFFDRDGVLNEVKLIQNKPHPPQIVDELVFMSNARNSILKLKKKGFYLLCVTNQPDYERGKQKKEIIEEFNEKVKTFFCLDEIFTCWHSKDGICNCRKPLPGLINTASSIYNIDKSKSYLIGDRKKDIISGLKAGCKTIFIDYNYNEEKPLKANYFANSTIDAVQWILTESQK